MPLGMFLDLGWKRKRGCTGISDPRYNFFLRCDSERIREQAARVSPSKDANLDTPPAHRPAGWFFQVNVVPVVRRAIGTIQKFSANRCAGVLPRCRALIYARRGELCRQPGRLP